MYHLLITLEASKRYLNRLNLNGTKWTRKSWRTNTLHIAIDPLDTRPTITGVGCTSHRRDPLTEGPSEAIRTSTGKAATQGRDTCATILALESSVLTLAPNSCWVLTKDALIAWVTVAEGTNFIRGAFTQARAG